MWLFLYISVYNPNEKKTKSNCNYKKAFGDAYSDYRLYIFYDSNNKIIYVVEVAEEEFKDRLSHHFNESDGGLKNKLSSKPNLLSKIMASNVLILYGKNNKEDSRSTHCIKIGNSTTIKKNSFDTRKCIKAFCFEFCIR